MLAELIPRAALLSNPDRLAPSLSPDGSRYAFLAPHEGVLNVWVSDLAEGAEPRPVTCNRQRSLFDYFWSPDGRQIFTFSDRDGDENWALQATDIETGQQRVVTPTEGVQASLLAADPNHPDRILIESNQRSPRAHDVYRLDVATGETTLVAENPGNVRFWIVDPQLRVRGMQLARPDAGFDLRVREAEGAPWRQLLSWEFDDAVTSRALGFSTDGASLLALDSRGAATGRLAQIQLDTGETSILAEDPEYDLGDVFGVDLIRHPRSRHVEAVAYFRERRAWKVLDPAFQEDLDALSRVDPGDLYIESRSLDGATWLVSFEADGAPIAFYSYDRISKTAAPLFTHRAELERYTLAATEPFRFVSRDGLPIHGYLTFPPGVDRHGLPVVVNPHGGPWGRDRWGFNSEIQWLANRGYLVMNINFRGSTTYGVEFVKAANKEWGRKMLWDLVDGARWAVERGYADGERIAIFGGSFGGYQALCGAAFTPDFFAAAIDVCGPSNLISFMNALPPWFETRKYRFWRRGGDPRTEEALLRERSPYFHAENIRIPMLIVQGANDVRVKQAESDRIVERLQANGVEHQYLLFPDEGHDLERSENWEIFYAAAEAFLARHLGGRQQEPAP